MDSYDIYLKYIESDAWAKLRNQALARDNYHCSICKNPNNLEVHHLKYPETLGTEPLSDLMTLCRDCHKRIEKYKKDHCAMQKMVYWQIPEKKIYYTYIRLELKKWDNDKVVLILKELWNLLLSHKKEFQIFQNDEDYPKEARPIKIVVAESIRDREMVREVPLRVIQTLAFENSIKNNESLMSKTENIDVFGENVLKKVNFDEYF